VDTRGEEVFPKCGEEERRGKEGKKGRRKRMCRHKASWHLQSFASIYIYLEIRSDGG
jgi:hypothetical protein